MTHITVLRALVLSFTLAVIARETGVPIDTLTSALVVVLRVLTHCTARMRRP